MSEIVYSWGKTVYRDLVETSKVDVTCNSLANHSFTVISVEHGIS